MGIDGNLAYDILCTVFEGQIWKRKEEEIFIVPIHRNFKLYFYSVNDSLQFHRRLLYSPFCELESN